MYIFPHSLSMVISHHRQHYGTIPLLCVTKVIAFSADKSRPHHSAIKSAVHFVLNSGITMWINIWSCNIVWQVRYMIDANKMPSNASILWFVNVLVYFTQLVGILCITDILLISCHHCICPQCIARDLLISQGLVYWYNAWAIWRNHGHSCMRWEC